MAMKIHELSPADGSRKTRKRVGRGPGSGHGKTSCRGHKGQKSRSGGGPRPGFEGGQMPLQRRLPKRGFTNIFKKRYNIINIKDLNRFEPNASLDTEALKKAGLVKKQEDGIKLLGNGEVTFPVFIKVHKVSNSAREKIEALGGTVEIISSLRMGQFLNLELDKLMLKRIVRRKPRDCSFFCYYTGDGKWAFGSLLL